MLRGKQLEIIMGLLLGVILAVFAWGFYVTHFGKIPVTVLQIENHSWIVFRDGGVTRLVVHDPECEKCKESKQ